MMDKLVELRRQDNGVWVLRLTASPSKGNFENKFTPALIEAIHKALDQVEADEGPSALVITSSGKFFSNGHDIEWLENAAKTGGTGLDSESVGFIRDFYKLLARFMTLSVITVAAINGHAFAGGCLLAMAQDYRVMRSDKGFICMNEIDMMLMTTPEQADKSFVKPGVFPNADAKMTAVLLSKLPTKVAREMFLTGKRYNGQAAHATGIVDMVATDESEVLEKAMELAKSFAPKGEKRNRRTVSVLKHELVRDYLGVLMETNTRL